MPPSYRTAGGEKRSPLPDFYIGAHAAVVGHLLLTRDATRYRTSFHKLELISPCTTASGKLLDYREGLGNPPLPIVSEPHLGCMRHPWHQSRGHRHG